MPTNTLLSICIAALFTLCACSSEETPPLAANNTQTTPSKPNPSAEKPSPPSDGSAPIGDPSTPPKTTPLKTVPTLDDLPALDIDDSDAPTKPKDLDDDDRQGTIAAAIGKDNDTPPRSTNAPSTSKTLSVLKAVIAREIKDRKPVGEGTSFNQPVKTLSVWLKVRNDGEPATVQTVWKREGRVMDRMDLNVGKGKGWRTWSRKTIGKKHTGSWTVEVLDPQGGVLKTLAFRVNTQSDVPKNLD